MQDKKEKKKLKELFVQDLARVQGGRNAPVTKPKCPEFTTLACGEEADGCSGC